MSSFHEYLRTDWYAMTLHDWIGLIITVTVFMIMVGIYAYVWHPANRQRLESQRFLPEDVGAINPESKQ